MSFSQKALKFHGGAPTTNKRAPIATVQICGGHDHFYCKYTELGKMPKKKNKNKEARHANVAILKAFFQYSLADYINGMVHRK